MCYDTSLVEGMSGFKIWALLHHPIGNHGWEAMLGSCPPGSVTIGILNSLLKENVRRLYGMTLPWKKVCLVLK